MGVVILGKWAWSFWESGRGFRFSGMKELGVLLPVKKSERWLRVRATFSRSNRGLGVGSGKKSSAAVLEWCMFSLYEKILGSVWVSELQRWFRPDMAAQRVPLSGCSQHSDPGSNSERSADSPQPLSESDSSGHVSPPNPDWTEERFRVDRKRLETLLLGRFYLLANKKKQEKLKVSLVS